MKHIPHVQSADSDTREIFAIARNAVLEHINAEDPAYGALVAAYMRTFCEAVKWRISEMDAGKRSSESH